MLSPPRTICRACRRSEDAYLAGQTPYTIAKALTEDGIETPGHKTVWQVSTVQSILTNEKYYGAALLQKTHVVDFLSKKVRPNRGELPQYYISEDHEPIIPPEKFKMVQEEMQRRKEAWTPREPKVTSGYLARYREMVTSGNRGAILEIPKTK